jgi:hypothetical protein
VGKDKPSRLKATGIEMSARCLLIEDGQRLILVDAGLGNKQSEKVF